MWGVVVDLFVCLFDILRWQAIFRTPTLSYTRTLTPTHPRTCCRAERQVDAAGRDQIGLNARLVAVEEGMREYRLGLRGQASRLAHAKALAEVVCLKGRIAELEARGEEQGKAEAAGDRVRQRLIAKVAAWSAESSDVEQADGNSAADYERIMDELDAPAPGEAEVNVVAASKGASALASRLVVVQQSAAALRAALDRSVALVAAARGERDHGRSTLNALISLVAAEGGPSLAREASYLGQIADLEGAVVDAEARAVRAAIEADRAKVLVPAAAVAASQDAAARSTDAAASPEVAGLEARVAFLAAQAAEAEAALTRNLHLEATAEALRRQVASAVARAERAQAAAAAEAQAGASATGDVAIARGRAERAERQAVALAAESKDLRARVRRLETELTEARAAAAQLPTVLEELSLWKRRAGRV